MSTVITGVVVGLPPDFIDGHLCTQALAAGRSRVVTSEVSTILGRPATTFAA